jgi:hypothetical protein
LQKIDFYQWSSGAYVSQYPCHTLAISQQATQEPIGFASLKAHPRRCFVAMRFPLKIDNRSLEAFLHISIFDNELNNNAR